MKAFPKTSSSLRVFVFPRENWRFESQRMADFQSAPRSRQSRLRAMQKDRLLTPSTEFASVVATTVSYNRSPHTVTPFPAHGGRRGPGMRVACLVAASRLHPWHKAQGRPNRRTLRRIYLFKARFSGVRRATSSNRGTIKKSEPEALAEFLRCAKNRLAPQAHGNEKSLLSAVSREEIEKIAKPKNRVQPGSALHRNASL
jgi:hypothetical protein